MTAAVAAVATACDVDLPTPATSPTPAPPPSAPTSTRPAIPLPPGAPRSTTTLTFNSDPGDFIGQGLSRTYYLGDGTWVAAGDPNHVRVTVTNFTLPTDGWSWDLDFAAPAGGTPLGVATYEDARRYPFQGAQPGLSVSGNSRGCGTLTGRFTVSDLALGPGGTLDRFTAAFEQHCEGMSPALRGTIVIAANPWRSGFLISRCGTPRPASQRRLGNRCPTAEDFPATL